VTTIGIIGSGHVSSSLAKAAVARGYDVVTSNSKGPQTLTGLVAGLLQASRRPSGILTWPDPVPDV